MQIVLNNGLPELHDFQASTLVDYRGDLEMKLGAKTDRAILIRPDAYVACDYPKIDPEILIAELKNWRTRLPQLEN